MRARRGRDAVGLCAGVAVLAVSGAIARRGVSPTELNVFRSANGLPDAAFPAIWAPMQYGTFGTVPALSIVAVLRGRRQLGAAIAVGGASAWLLAKVAKPVVGRGRPASTVPDVVIRGTEEGDLGFPSGHAAVSAALTTVIRPYLAGTWKEVPSALSAIVPFARMYVGAHLPLDAVGGSALGVAVGCAVNLALGVPRDRSRRAPRR
jgi:glycosyltransferase 2 family protein